MGTREGTVGSRLEVSVTAPFAIGDVVARVHLTDGNHVLVVLRDGYFSGHLPATPLRLTLTTDPAPAGEAPLRPPSDEAASRPEGRLVDVHTLFEDGCDVPEDGRLTVRLLWGTPCHYERLPDAPEGKRFASWEHVICARYVGLDADLATRLTFNGITASFTEMTKLPVGYNDLTFGEIICLGGDFYAHLDSAAAHDFEWAWPPLRGFVGWLTGDYRGQTLRDADFIEAKTLLEIIARDKDENRGAAGEFAVLAYAVNSYLARRYLALASQNYCHFACPAPGWSEMSNAALRLYRGYHTRALQEARAARNAVNTDIALRHALATDAFGCHFLTDLFASGHMRVPRRLLGDRYGVLRGALGMSLRMHAEDNELGLWCTTRLPRSPGERVVWRAYGDGLLRQEVAALHLQQVQEAVRRSAAEVFAAYCESQLPESDRAEAMLPIALPPGEAPRLADKLPDGAAVPLNQQPNHWPLYWFLDDGTVLRRTGAPHTGEYCAQEDLERRYLRPLEAFGGFWRQGYEPV
jgi:hypothetical protein